LGGNRTSEQIDTGVSQASYNNVNELTAKTSGSGPMEFAGSINNPTALKYMNNPLWQLPVPATGLIRGPRFEVLPKRQCQISFSIEGDSGEEKWLSLLFENVEAYKSTYLTSLGAVEQNLPTEAYGKIIAVENSEWLTAVKESYSKYCQTTRLTPKDLQHLAICFDDGPCYEIICTGFKAL
jgi:hypothetical protein